MSDNLPPGCSESDIPGNRPEDVAWERVHEMIDKDATKGALTDMEVHAAWKLGLAAFKEARKLKVEFPFDGPKD